MMNSGEFFIRAVASADSGARVVNHYIDFFTGSHSLIGVSSQLLQKMQLVWPTHYPPIMGTLQVPPPLLIFLQIIAPLQ